MLSKAKDSFTALIQFLVAHPKGSLIAFWMIVLTGFLVWRFRQPFDAMQSVLLWVGPGVGALGYVSIRLEQKDEPRRKAMIMGYAVTLLGLFLSYLAYRPMGV